MEEKVNEILGMESEQLTLEEEAMRAAPVEPNTEKKDKNGAEKTLSGLADIILIVGIIVTIICLFTLCFVEVPKSMYSTEKVFSPSGFATTIMVLFSSLISWSVMRVLANISLTLKELNGKIKEEQSVEATPHSKSTNTSSVDDKRIETLKTMVETGALSQEEYDEEVQKIKGEE